MEILKKLDNIIFTIIYYLLCSPFYFFVFYLMMKRGDKEQYRFSNQILTISFFIYFLPAPLVFYGNVFSKVGFDRGFDIEVMFIYLLFSIVICISWIFSYFFCKYYPIITFEQRKLKNIRVLIVLFIVVGSTLLFVNKVSFFDLPNISLITEGFIKAYELKFSIRGSDDAFISKFTAYALLIVLPIFFMTYVKFKTLDDNKIHCAVVLCLLFVFVFFLLTVRLSRGGIVYFLVSFFSLSCLLKNKSLIKPMFFVLFIAVSMFFILSSNGSLTIYESFYNLLNRLVMQHSFVYLQLPISKDVNLINSINLPVLSRLLDFNYLNVSNLTYIKFYNNGNDSGSTAGMAIAQLYFSFGFLGAIILFLGYSFVFCIDNYSFSKFNKNINNDTIVICSFYYAFHAIFLMPFLTNFYSLFSFDIIFSPNFLLFIGLFLFFVKIKIFRIL